MSETDKKKPEEDTEVTPGGLEVRTPRRDEFFSNLEKVSRPDVADNED